MNEEKKRILKMVEEGLISADEAADLLDSLERNEQRKEKGASKELSTDIDWENQHQFHQSRQTSDVKSFKKKFVNFVEDTIKKVKNADLDFNFGSHYKVSHIYQYSDVAMNEIDIDIENGSLSVQVWDEKDVRIECEAKVYQAESEREAKDRLLKDLYIDTDQKLSIRSQTKKMKLDLVVYVPEQAYERVSARLFNGAVKLNELSAEKLKVRTSNGKIHLYQMTGEDWEVKSANGAIHLEKVTCHECEAETMNGAIHLDGDFEKVESQTINGTIRCYWEGERSHTGFFKTVAGSILLYLPDKQAIDGELKTNMGSLKCELPVAKMIKNDQDMLKKSMRFQTKPEAETFLHIEAETRTGSIKVHPLTENQNL